MYVEYGTVCATSASGAHNLGGGVRGVRKSGVHISPLPSPRRLSWQRFSAKVLFETTTAEVPKLVVQRS